MDTATDKYPTRTFETAYKHGPLLVVEKDKAFRPFKMGVAKAKALIEIVDQMKAFVAKHDKPQEELPQ